ncbi:MAG TPA: radical SAM family heme chaperone HemW [Candidatus Babeliales bacterium]|nr:radical SAM family heme chaperone HemW [Candidatus Babeliales bacterium]
MQYNTATHTKSLYIHWPFCPYKCHFCPFVALAKQDHLMDRYHAALIREIQIFAQTQRSNTAIETIHFGGGTPSTYPTHLLLDMMSILKKEFNITSGAEIAFEVNPGTVHSQDHVIVWSKAGINRLSIGIQSTKDIVLRTLNRHQSIDQVYSLLQWVDGVFDNISIDLILGLPDVSTQEWKKTINEVLQWPIKHISIYFLTIHEGTPLYKKVHTNQIILPDDQEIVSLYKWTCKMLAKYNFIQYELSNFAKIGYESRHNSAYWDRIPYRGFGIGACSFDGVCRFQNEKNIMRYMDSIERQQETFIFCETLTEQQILLEQLMLGLRRPKGVKWHTIIEKSSDASRQKINAAVYILEQKKLIEWQGDAIRLTHQGFAVENEILVQLSQ